MGRWRSVTLCGRRGIITEGPARAGSPSEAEVPSGQHRTRGSQRQRDSTCENPTAGLQDSGGYAARNVGGLSELGVALR